MKVKVRMPGTCGEWIQTFHHASGKECLVSASIALYNELIAYESDRETALQSQMHLMPKSKAALNKAASHLGLTQADLDHIVFCRGEMALSIGKGMASSTADIAALMMAISVLKGSPLEEATLLKLCCEIEPSDGTMLSGTHLIDHLNGSILESYNDIPEAKILMLLPHTVYDTEKLRLREDYFEKLTTKSKLALESFKLGISRGDLNLIGKASTQSLIENESILPKRYLSELIELYEKHSCYGLLGGHSGTVTGILLKNGIDLEKLRFELDNSSLSRYYNEMTVVQAVGGGLTYEVTEA